MKLSKEEIQHIADLARLDLSEAEFEKYGCQLSGVLDYIDQLQEVDTDDLEPTAQVTGLENVYRNDEIKVWADDERKAALALAPDLEDGQVKVRRVL